MAESKLIDYRLFDPSMSYLFKVKKTERAELRLLLCTGWDRCELYSQGMCTMWRFSDGNCPYGKINFISGPSRKAIKFRDFIRSCKEKVAEITKQLSVAPDKMSRVGDYIFFPYPFWSLDESMPLRDGEFGTIFGQGIEFIPAVRFTVEFVQAVLNSRPRALMGGEITDYQKKHVPMIVIHLEEVLPDLFREWSAAYQETAQRFSAKNHVGRKALISSLPVGTVIPHKDGSMVWDGNGLVIDAYSSVFLPVKVESATLSMIPRAGETVKITSNDQVGPGTKFVD